MLTSSALFGAKNFRFLKIYYVFSRTRGGEPVQLFFGEGDESIFRDFGGHLLRTAPYRLTSLTPD